LNIYKTKNKINDFYYLKFSAVLGTESANSSNLILPTSYLNNK